MNRHGRKISLGTCFMLVLTLLVMIGTTLVLIRLSHGNRIVTSDYDLSEKNASSEQKGRIASSQSRKNRQSGQGQSGPSVSTSEELNTISGGGGRFTLTVAGTVAVEDEILTRSYLSDIKTYDISDIMSLIRSDVSSDVNIVFVENILMDNARAKNIIAPSDVAGMLKNAGFNIAACGFSGAWNKKEEGIIQTRKNFSESGITPVGIYEPGEGHTVQIANYGGIHTAILQYTGSISKNDRNKMKSANQSDTVPQADATEIAEDIAAARKQGADLVIILMNWGSKGKVPDKSQKQLAQQIADAGADMIIGSGSRTPQQAEYLTSIRPDGSQAKVLCIWSLGVTLSQERKNNKQMAGYLFHAEIVMDSSMTISVSDISYTPLYTWLYKQDGRYYYRCLAGNRTLPDGMEIEQQNKLAHVVDVTREALKDSPLIER